MTPVPLALTRQSTKLLWCQVFVSAPQIARAFQETDPRRGRESLEVVEVEDGGMVDEPVDDELISVRVDAGDTGVVSFEVQIGTA